MFGKRGTLLLILIVFILMNIHSINSGNCPGSCPCADGSSCQNYVGTTTCDIYNICVTTYSCSGTVSCGTDAWYNSGSAYACCSDSNTLCSSCQNQIYGDYYCSSGYCYYQEPYTQTVKSGCTTCDIYNGCLGGGQYWDYSCSGSSCIFYQYLERDSSSTYCACLGVGLWSIGGEADAATCCTDDASEYRITEASSTDAPSPYNTGSGTTCCNPLTDCTESGTDTCTATGSAAGTIPSKAYCSSSTWYGGDASSNVCTAIVGAGYWQIGGEVAGTACCGDDGSGENRVTEASSTDAPAGFNGGGTTCCSESTECTDDDNCVANTGTRGTIPSKAYCSSSTWYGGDAGQTYCDAIAGVSRWNIGKGETAITTCCGDDNGEYKITQGVAGSVACCNKETDCVDRNNRCQNEYGKETTCNDGFDNDCDKKTDCSDTDCVSVCLPDCTPEVCTGGIDEDCDHWADCADNDCIGDPACATCNGGSSAVTEICNDDKDNDCDGKKDCADNDCIGSLSCPGCSAEVCTGGDDEDCDTFIDNADWDCSGCPKGTALCKDGKTCSIWCEEGVLGCVGSPDGKCTEGEGCACADCKNKRDSCEKGLICDPVQQFCSCPVGTQICSDGSCKKICNVCGMNGLEPGEECDGSILPTGIQTCEALGLTGTIGCTNCFITGCTDGPKDCGNGVIQTGETCDGTNLAAKICSTFGFAKGTLSCFAKGTVNECHFDTSNCYNENLQCEDDNKCDTAGGEDCTCLDCLGEQAPCGFGQLCDETARCKCEDGTTLCGVTCKLPTNCQTFPECDGDGVCEIGEGCSCSSGSGCVNNICNDCNSKSDTCKSSSTCVNGLCTTCSILKAYWSEECIGSEMPDGVSMIVEGIEGCKGKTVTLDLKEQDDWDEATYGGANGDDDVETLSATFDDKGKAELKWTPKWRGPDIEWNDCALLGCTIGADAGRYYESPPKKFLEYYFEAEIGRETVISEVLNVHYCIPDCDADCDTYVDKDLQIEPDCTSALASDPAYGQYGGSLKIDSNPKSGYCEDCRPDGLSPGQETCAAYYDCTPDWWTKPGETETPSQSPSESLQDISSALEWSECDEASKIRTRKICHDSFSVDCCKDQSSCYCKIPTDLGVIQKYDCDSLAFRPTEIKACLAEEKFPFFTNMNLLVVVLILTGFYIWKNREQEKTKTKRRNRIKH
ncbi:MAG: hypothetical protein Q8O03_04955 [Nanoarchaeota archaeon]|nr:hypothetical protein [Nanoarchaeota archaeon]